MSARPMIAATLAALLAGCPGSGDDHPDAAPTPPAWQVVLSNLEGTLLSVWGTSPSDVWAVGGPRGNSGFESLVLRFDGQRWTRARPGGAETYWWVHGASATDVWLVGEKGRITHFDGARFSEHASGTTATLFGVWAASANDAWAVGGTPSGTGAGPNDVVLHWDGTSWTPSPLPKALGRAYFKIWGASADELFVVGELGAIWHRTGGAWALESDPPIAHGTLLTVSGCGRREVYAVGGRDVLRYDGAKWAPEAIPLVNDVNGVACGPSGRAAIVGFGGSKRRLEGGAWIDDAAAEPFTDLHGAWSDGAGAFWAVGGDFVSGPSPGVSRRGVVARYGAGTVPTTLDAK